MPDYRLYLLDAQGRIRIALDLDCRDDEHARAMAASEAPGATVELWRGTRLLDHREADTGPPGR